MKHPQRKKESDEPRLKEGDLLRGRSISDIKKRLSSIKEKKGVQPNASATQAQLNLEADIGDHQE